MLSRLLVVVLLNVALAGLYPAWAQPLPPVPMGEVPLFPSQGPPTVLPSAEGEPTRAEVLDGILSGAGQYLDQGRFWFAGEYLLAFTRPMATGFTLASSGPRGSGAVLGRPGVTAAFGSEERPAGPMHGFRLGMGFWFSPRPVRTFGFEVSGFFLPDRTDTRTLDGSGGREVGRPFFDTVLNGENTRLVNLPGTFTGSVNWTTASSVWGLDVGPVLRVVEEGSWSLDQTFGLKVLGLDERYEITDTATANAGGVFTQRGVTIPGPATQSVADLFKTHSGFVGGSIGGRINYVGDRWSTSLGWRFSGGLTQSSGSVNGTTTTTGPNLATQTSSGGLLVPASLVRTQTVTSFSYVPEVTVKLGYRFSERWSVNLGYEFLYWSQVMRPDQNLNRLINPTSIPSNASFGRSLGGSIPPSATRFEWSDFWLHGLNVGAKWSF